MSANDNGRARAIDDKANLDDLHRVEQSIIAAQEALRKAMVGLGPKEREAFVFHVGFALGRLQRVAARIYPVIREESDA